MSLLVLGVGCSSTLETGYEPRRLGASDAERRSYYVNPFSPEAQAAQQERDRSGFDAMRTRPGGY